MPPQRVWFRSENGHRLCPYVFVWNRVSGIEDGFRGNCSSVWTNSSFQFQISKKEGITRECEMNFTKEILLLAFQSYSWWHDFIYQLGLSLNTENLRPLLKKKSDRNGAYEGKVIKVLINVWNCSFKSSQWIEQCDIPCPYGVGRRNTCMLAVCKSTLPWSELSTNGQRIVVWHHRERLASTVFYTA